MAPTRVFVVEDNCMIAWGIMDALRHEGFEVIGPEGALGDAVTAASARSFDVALLDLHIQGGDVYPVADILVKRGLPFAFLTGDRSEAVTGAYRRVPVVEKPASVESVVGTLRRLLPAA